MQARFHEEVAKLRNTDVATRGGKRACNSNTGVIDGIVPSVAKNNVSS